MEHGLQISLKIYALSMEDKMAVGAFERYELWVRRPVLVVWHSIPQRVNRMP